MEIEITEKEIIEGIRCDCENCPVALALRKYFFSSGQWKTVNVASAIIVIGGVVYKIGKKLKKWINDYDKLGSVHPIRIKLEDGYENTFHWPLIEII